MSEEIIKRNHVNSSGKGNKVLLFAHGFGCDQLVWQKVIPFFEEDYRVVRLDYVGSGKSDKSAYSAERYSSLDGYKQDILEVIDALKLEEVTFIGHSVSSMIGVLASIDRPDLFKQLVMICPSPYFMNEIGYAGGFEEEDLAELLDMMELNYKEWAKYLAPVVIQNESSPELAEEFEALLCSNDPIIARQFAEVTFSSDMRKELEEVAVKTFILHTKYDAIAPIEIGQYVHEKIKESEFTVLDATGHNPHMSHPEETAMKIKHFLER